MPAPAPAAPPWSVLEAALIRGKTRLIACKNIQPLNLFQPASLTSACHVVLSSYGGGMVAGDVIRRRILGGADKRLITSTQASTKIFRSIAGAVAAQHTVGELGENTLAVVFPNPVEPQAQSCYSQVQEWHLQPSTERGA